MGVDGVRREGCAARRLGWGLVALAFCAGAAGSAPAASEVPLDGAAGPAATSWHCPGAKLAPAVGGTAVTGSALLPDPGRQFVLDHASIERGRGVWVFKVGPAPNLGLQPQVLTSGSWRVVLPHSVLKSARIEIRAADKASVIVCTQR